MIKDITTLKIKGQLKKICAIFMFMINIYFDQDIIFLTEWN